ncbi:MAG: hypothetical protein PHE88_09930 [Elusimicrobia bacterium]|nr:hypothetical protein [Elusimicrobiota bacterium]
MKKVYYLILFMFCLTFVNAVELTKIFLVSSVNDNIATQLPKYVLKNEKINLYCIVEINSNQKITYFTSAKNIKIDEKTISLSDIKKWDENELGKIEIQWYKVEPYMIHNKLGSNDPEIPQFDYYANAHLPFCSKNRGWIGYDTIEYKETELVKFKNQWQINVDAHPTAKEYDINDGMGVMRYKVSIKYFDETNKEKIISTPGKESTNYYGIKPDVHKIFFRYDNSYLGWMSSYFNVPGVFGSTEIQVKEYTGIDCADLVVASYNKSTDKNIPLTNVSGLTGLLKKVVGNIYLFPDGNLYDSTGENKKPVKIDFGGKIKPGDVIFFDYPEGDNMYGYWDHVGVIYKDSGENGIPDNILNNYDLIMHAGFAEPHLSLLNDQGFVADNPTKVMIMRW